MDFCTIIIILSALASYLAVHWFYFRILKIAKLKNLVDNPDARKLQKEPVPVMGGIAVFIGTVVGVMVGLALSKIWGEEAGFLQQLPIFSAMVAMLYVGAIDDIIGMSPRSRLVIELLAMLCVIYGGGLCIDNFYGIFGIEQFSWWLGVPLTIFAGIGIINAINMVDGVNGLSSGLCITCSMLFGVLFVKSGDLPNAVLAASMTTALIPFFFHNVFGKKSRMFIGDAGTMVLGILMVWFVINTLGSAHVKDYYEQTSVNRIALVLAILSVPVFDTLRVMVQRVLSGKSPFDADKTHLHHAFISIGISHSFTTLSEILINLAVVAVWYVSAKIALSFDMQLCIVTLTAIVLVWGTYIFLSWQTAHETRLINWLRSKSIRTHFGNKNWWQKLQQWLDNPEKEIEAPKKAEEVPVSTKEKFALTEK